MFMLTFVVQLILASILVSLETVCAYLSRFSPTTIITGWLSRNLFDEMQITKPLGLTKASFSFLTGRLTKLVVGLSS